ncbi:MAG: hypothetical protein FRX48_03184 [Lasallia pustulata]|uniref:DUF1750-domain-containing protein n=1 Tax=Lasallia pustulata TaxID=136370 RepID=A0A5M8PUW3_9LECA|nr:MAG: hypothetical protein FRX48_03184 [Lasallia pustulata]
MEEPSNGVPRELLPHIHLVSTYRYPYLKDVSLDTVIGYLLEAPRITRDIAAMNWVFLDAPTDGSLMLVWQPLNQVGIHFASDGYIWADAEQAFSLDSKGYTVEMYIHRSGYKPPEHIATHCRRRYRLLPGKNANPNMAPCDPFLWIVHYSRADPANELPANQIRPDPTILYNRRFLQQQGVLKRKDFMLHDRVNYPNIKLPVSSTPQYAQQISGYPGNVISHMNRSQPLSYYPPRQAGNMASMGASPAKRQRATQQANIDGPTSSAANGAANGIGQDSKVTEEEDTSHGDLMDLLTPQDISGMRYMQHHEWLEEVFSSPYTTAKIIPVALGLGRKGELESLTSGFFEAPTGLSPKPKEKLCRKRDKEDVPERVGRMEVGKAEDFTKLASQRISDLTAEMEKMKRQHAKRMTKLKQGATILSAEKKLRNAIASPADSGTEFWKLERDSGPQVNTASNDGALAAARASEHVSNIIKEVEGVVGKRIGPQSDVTTVQRGGLEERQQVEIRNAPESAALDKLGGQSNGNADTGGPSKKFPVAYETAMPMSRVPSSLHQDHSTAGTPHGIRSHMATPAGEAEMMGNNQATAHLPPADNDTVMTGTSNGMDLPVGGGNGGNQAAADGEGSEWVMVNRDEDADRMAQATEESFGADAFTHDTGMDQSMDTPGVFINTPGSGLQGLTPATAGNVSEDYNASVFNDTVDFSALDSAGDALAGYGEQSDMGLDEHGDLGLDTSAFGEAFHGTEPSVGREDATES